MFKKDDLHIISKSLDYSIANLENYLNKYSEYLCDLDKVDIMYELKKHEEISSKVRFTIEANGLYNQNIDVYK
ncbi:MAG: hypothetical protein N4A48_10265 [Tepidibacter sp.]|jgi:hypothetical protein|uniref:hypothetical protein n=1 Tax=Tepidibacter sp. TaxID=2529387 RepID=UPI0025DEC820|nr:hypothetical protein [Tepidibacter sp.]MCT4509124.1 hypothetical protein [Tepidibacter sp.]